MTGKVYSRRKRIKPSSDKFFLVRPPDDKVFASCIRNRPGRWSLAGGYAVFLLVVSLLPGRNLPAIPDWFALFSPDKVAHFGAYGVFALLLSVAIFDRSIKWATMPAVLYASCYGVGMEILQAVSGTGRSFDYVDMVANLLGAILGGLGFWLLKTITK